MKAHLLTCATVLISLASTTHAADWRQIAPGIEYKQETLPGPVEIYVARADRKSDKYMVGAMMAKGTSKGAREKVPDMAERYDNTVDDRGMLRHAKIAINGDYFPVNTGIPLGGEIIDGWYVRRYGEYNGLSGFVWTLDHRVFMGGNVENGPKYQTVRFSDGTALHIDKLNDPRGNNELALYTWHYADRTDTVESGVEVVVRMSAPTCVLPDNGGTPGEIVAVKQSTGGTPLLYGDVILSGQGKTGEALLAHAKMGQKLGINLALTDYGNKDIGLGVGNWKGAYTGLGAAQNILVNGNVPRHWEKKAARYAEQGKVHGSVVKDPRTLVAFNDDYIFFVVVDGRSPKSLGMTFTDAGEFCRDHLKATYGMTQDGGGSSTMWVEGQVQNNPSGKPGMEKGGELRAVANGYYMAAVEPAKRSTTFKPGDKVAVAGRQELRLGPGTQFGVATTLPADSEGVVLDHKLTGIQAKGKQWWNCKFAQTEGWAAEDGLKSAK